MCEKNLHDLERKVESESLILFEWFHDIYLKANSGKSYAMLTTDNKLKINVKGIPISNEKIVKLLGVTVDNKLSFEPHLNLLCKNVSQKIHALAKVSKFISRKETKSYHVAVQLLSFGIHVMCHSRALNKKMNKLHERALRLVNDDRQSKFDELLNIDKSVTIHYRNLQVIATELYKVHHGLAPELINDIFKKSNVTYNFRKNSAFETRNIKSVYYGSETISFTGPKIRKLLSSNIKDSENLNIFKSNIKSWKSEKLSMPFVQVIYCRYRIFCKSVCTFVYVCGTFVCMQLCSCVCSLYVRVCACMCVYTYAYVRLCVHATVCPFVHFFLIPTSRCKA